MANKAYLAPSAVTEVMKEAFSKICCALQTQCSTVKHRDCWCHPEVEQLRSLHIFHSGIAVFKDRDM